MTKVRLRSTRLPSIGHRDADGSILDSKYALAHASIRPPIGISSGHPGHLVDDTTHRRLLNPRLACSPARHPTTPSP